MPITLEQLAAWKAVLEAATPGPWHALYHDNDDELGDVAFCVAYHSPIMSDDHILLSVEGCEREDEREQWPRDVLFIAAARTALPALIAEVERLQTRVQEVESLLHETLAPVECALFEGIDHDAEVRLIRPHERIRVALAAKGVPNA